MLMPVIAEGASGGWGKGANPVLCPAGLRLPAPSFHVRSFRFLPVFPSLPAFSVSALRTWLRSFRPGRMRINGRERLRIVLGALAGVLLAAWASRTMAGELGAAAWMVAPLGASAVLVFAVPASPWPSRGR